MKCLKHIFIIITFIWTKLVTDPHICCNIIIVHLCSACMSLSSIKTFCVIGASNFYYEWEDALISIDGFTCWKANDISRMRNDTKINYLIFNAYDL